MPFLITAAILAFLAVLLSFRVRIVVRYENGFIINLKYLFFTIRMNRPEKGKTKKGRKAPAKAEKAQNKKLSGFLELFHQYSDILEDTAKKVLRKISIEWLCIRITICEDDAAKTALRFGEACAVVYPACSLLDSRYGVRKHEISIQPVFGEGESKVYFECTLAGMRLIGVLVFGIEKAASLILRTIRLKKPAQKSVKDGA